MSLIPYGPTYTVQDSYATRYLPSAGGGLVDPPRYRPMLDIARRAVAQDWYVTAALCTAETLDTGAAGGVIVIDRTYVGGGARVEVDPPVSAGAVFASAAAELAAVSTGDPLIIVRSVLHYLRFITDGQLDVPSNPALIRRISLTSYSRKDEP